MSTPDNTDATYLSADDVRELRGLLEEKRQSLLRAVRGAALQEGEELADELDVARAEYESAFDHRLCERSVGLLKKVEKALRRLEAGEYDECESCGEPITRARLMARPEATLCIECKEEQERDERQYMKRRLLREEEGSFTI